MRLFLRALIAASLALPSVAAAQDTTPPAISSLVVSPLSVDLDAQPATVVSMTATLTDPSGIGPNCYMLYRSPTGVITPALAWQALGGDQYGMSFTLPSNFETGTWQPFTLHLVDGAGNEAFYDQQQIENVLGFSGLAITLYRASPTDVTPPQLSSFSVSPSSIDVTSGGASASVTMSITDDLSGISPASQITFFSPSGAQSVSAPLAIAQTSGTLSFSGSVSVTIPRGAEPGAWVLVAHLVDVAGNAAVYGPAFNQLTVADTDPDTTAPALSAYGVYPHAIDLSSGSAVVTFSATVVDAQSAVREVRVGVRSQSGLSTFEFALAVDSAGNWSLTQDVPYGSLIEAGHWTTDHVTVVDTLGNQHVYSPAELQAAGFDGSLDVTNPLAADTTPPTLLALDASAASVDVTNGARSVALQATASDAGSGVQQGFAYFTSPSGTQVLQAALVGGTNGLGTTVIFGDVTFSPFVELGTWTLTGVSLTDNSGNTGALGPAELAAAGISVSIVVSSSPDTTPPSLDAISVDAPAAVSGTSGSISVTAAVSDDRSGFSYGQIVFVSPSTAQSATGVFMVEGSNAGVVLSGTVRAYLQISPFAEPGTWTVQSVFLSDAVGNVLSLSSAQLPALSFTVTDPDPDVTAPTIASLSANPTSVDVTSNAASIDFAGDFFDAQSGFSSAIVELLSPSGTTILSGWFMSQNTSGVGALHAVIVIPAGAEAGIWSPRLTTTDAIGNSRSWSSAELDGFHVAIGVTKSVSASLAPGATLSSSTNPPTPSEPVTTAVTAPGGGTVSITETFIEQPLPAAYEAVGVQMNIIAPVASVGAPLTLVFDLDASLIPAGGDETTIAIFRDGFAIGPCTGAAGTASPDPCVFRRVRLVSGAVELGVYSSHASAWNLAIHHGPVYAFTGFFPPLANLPVVNQANAGSTIPIKFSLGGNRGRDVFESGSPASVLSSGGTETPIDGQLQYDAAEDRYIFLWRTSRTFAGQTRDLVLRFRDGSVYRARVSFH